MKYFSRGLCEQPIKIVQPECLEPTKGTETSFSGLQCCWIGSSCSESQTYYVK